MVEEWTNWKTPDSATDEGGGDKSWADLPNIAGAGFAVSVLAGGPESSNIVHLTDFDFADDLAALADTDEIFGIEVLAHFQKEEIAGSPVIEDEIIQIVQGGIEVGSNKAANEWPTSDTEFIYGGTLDTWGLSLTKLDVVDVGFGVAIQAICDGGQGNARIVSVEMRLRFENGDPAEPDPGRPLTRCEDGTDFLARRHTIVVGY